jgi:acyl-CoA thioester hydrolase
LRAAACALGVGLLGALTVEARERRIQFIHTMRNTETDQIASMCDLTAVHIDRRVRKASPFPESVRVAAERLIISNP